MMNQISRAAARASRSALSTSQVSAKRVPAVGSQQFHASAAAEARVLCSDPIDPICVEILEANGHQVDQPGKMDVPELLSIIGNYEGLVVRSGTKVTPEVLEAATNLKIIGRAGTGVDNINLPAATKKGVLVMNTPGGNTVSTAEHSMALITSLARKLPQNVSAVKAGNYAAESHGTELSGKTLGVVGLGKIGREVAKWAQAMNMTVIGYDPILAPEVSSSAGIDPVTLDDVWARSDFITLHTPLTTETRDLISESVLAACKPGVRIVNCARGGIINEDALLAALKSGQCGGVALDVYSSEPPPESMAELLNHPNCIATPHLGASTSEAQVNVARAIAVQFSEAFNNTRFHGVLNAPSVHLARRADLMPYMSLAEKMGSIQAQLLGNAKLQRVTLAFSGRDVASPEMSGALTSGALRGLLTQVLDEEVNLVNAALLAKDLGLDIAETREETSSTYANKLTITFETDAGSRSLTGTVFGHSQQRIVAVDDYQVDIAPEGSMLFFNNSDTPGVLNNIVDVFAKHDINIANFGLGRHEVGSKALGIIAADSALSADALSDICAVPNISNVACVACPEVDTSLPMLYVDEASQAGASGGDDLPAARPLSSQFSSGPCKKRPGWNLSALSNAAVGRSHRSSLGKQKLALAIEKSKQILGIPADYHVGIVPASDTGAMEMGMWSLLGERPVDVAYWESFGKGWWGDVNGQLKLKDAREISAPYGELPDMSQTNPDHDIIFPWNGTTSGVKVDNGDWISDSRGGLTLCDATSAVFAMDLPWEKLDYTTYSWQKVLGGEGGHGVVVMSPRAVERLESYTPSWPMPKIFRMVKGGKLDAAIFKGSTINTPSMLCVEDYLDALNWAEEQGGLQGLIQRSSDNLAVLEAFVEENDWIDFLAADPAVRSNTSICLKLNGLDSAQIKAFTALLERENVALDIGAYRDAPDGLRIWGGATVEKSDLEALLPWLTWAYDSVSQPQQE